MRIDTQVQKRTKLTKINELIGTGNVIYQHTNTQSSKSVKCIAIVVVIIIVLKVEIPEK
jgi:hypothetical protein